MNNSGYEEVRERIAQSLNRRFDTKFSQNNIIMTVGAAGGLNVALRKHQTISHSVESAEHGSYS